MAGIRFLSTSSVEPATAKHHAHLSPPLDLTPWDLQYLRFCVIQRGILFHKPTPQQLKELGHSVISHLKHSLAMALDIFYPLAGRLAAVQHHDGTTSFYVDCNGAGAQFVHAAADGICVADIREAEYVPEVVDSFFLLQGVLNCEGVSKPLLGVQVTELFDGFFIGCTVNHSVVDGTSLWNFFNTWSEISRSGKTTRPPPTFDRSFLNGIVNFPVRVRFPQHRALSKSPLTLPPQKILRFSKERIAELKAKANLEMNTSKISSLQAILGHLWRAVNRHGTLPTEHEIKYVVVVGTRQRFQPPIPETYFGNAVQVVAARTSVGELLNHGLGWAAWRINQAIASQGGVEECKKLENCVKNSYMPGVGELSSTSMNRVITGGSPRFDVYGNDFGWGKPVAVLPGSNNKVEGLLAVFPGEEEGSVDFECCLSEVKLKAMLNDADFAS